MGRIALCADLEALEHPSLMGLDDVSLEGCDWLALYSDARTAREEIASSADIDEVWVVSCRGMEPINLAASLKRDKEERRVFLVSDAATGSCLSRARAAGINGTLTVEGFCRRYASERRVRGFSREALPGEPVPEGAPVSSRGCGGAAGGPLLVPAVFLDSSAGLSLLASEDDIVEEDFLPADPSIPGRGGGSPLSGSGRELVSETSGGVVLAVSSAGGGAGKSALSVIAASFLARRGIRTVLLDGDFAGGDSALLSGEKAPVHFDELFGPDTALAANAECFDLPSCPAGYALVAAPERIEVGEAARPFLPQAVSLLSSRFDAVVVNADACWDEAKVALLERSTHALCLVDQRMSSVRLSQRIVSLCARCGVAATSMNFVLNRVSKEAAFSSIDVSCALQGARVFELADGGRVVEELLGMGMPLSLLEEGNAFCSSVEALLQELLPELFGCSPVGFGGGKSRRRGFLGQGFRRVKTGASRGGEGCGNRAS